MRLGRRTLLTFASCKLALGCARPSRPSSVSEQEQPPTRLDDESEASTLDAEEESNIFSWVSAQQLVEPGNRPPTPLRGAVLRQRLLLSVGGTHVRLALSNEYGKEPLEVEEADLAFPAQAEHIETGTGGALLFGGKSSVAVPPGETVTSDPLDFAVPDGAELAVTLKLGNVPLDLTGHPGSRTTSFIFTRDESDDEGASSPRTTDHWYFISGLSVVPREPARALVILGDSITDGRGSTTNQNDRYPNLLSRRFEKRTESPKTAVLNQGIGGNSVLRGGLGPTVLERYERDALSLPKVHAVLLFAGINDLGALHGTKPGDPDRPRAEHLIEAFSRISADARKRGIEIFAATLLPFEGSFYFTEEGEKERQAFNDWIRRTGVLDGFIDFDAITRDERHPTRLDPAVDGGDHLHPSAAGYQIMAEAIDLELFD